MPSALQAATNATHFANAPARREVQLTTQRTDLVKRIAYHLVARMPASVEVDDLIQAGMIGLLEAARHYEASKGANFDTYAGIRIRGAMLDELRRSDWTPRSVHRKFREVSTAVRDIESQSGREARDGDVAARLGIGLGEYHRIMQDAIRCRVFSLDEPGERDSARDVLDTQADDPLDSLADERFRAELIQQIDALPQREKLVMSLYYSDELTLKEIGAVLGVTESRVCQLHGQALVRLRARLGDWLDE